MGHGKKAENGLREPGFRPMKSASFRSLKFSLPGACIETVSLDLVSQYGSIKAVLSATKPCLRYRKAAKHPLLPPGSFGKKGPVSNGHGGVFFRR
jgi:hypothetical protein